MRTCGALRTMRSTTASPAGPAPTMAMDKGTFASGEADVFVIRRQPVDSALRRRDPAGDLAGRRDRAHQAFDESLVGGRRQPFVALHLPRRFADGLARWIDEPAGPGADGAMEARARQRQAERETGVGDQLAPALHAAVA